MKKNVTELVFILDKSGSMEGKELDTIGGFNSTLKSQKENNHEAYVTTYLFSDDSIMIHDRLPIKSVKTLTTNDYQVGGCTALIDTIGEAIKHIETIHKYQNKKDVPNNTIFVIMTDGLENASHKYSSEEVKKMIEVKKELNWEFLFLAANIDAIETAKRLSIKEDRAVDFAYDEVGFTKAFGAVSKFMNFVVEEKSIGDNWRQEVDEDFKSKQN